jgi:3-dehydro-L-gulonate 2-dehydrogenase
LHGGHNIVSQPLFLFQSIAHYGNEPKTILINGLAPRHIFYINHIAIISYLFAGILSQGNTTASVDKAGYGNGGACSQVFIAIDPLKISNQAFLNQALEATINQIHHSKPAESGAKIQYPGEGSLRTRKENQALGVPVHEAVWERVKALAGL